MPSEDSLCNPASDSLQVPCPSHLPFSAGLCSQTSPGTTLPDTCFRRSARSVPSLWRYFSQILCFSSLRNCTPRATSRDFLVALLYSPPLGSSQNVSALHNFLLLNVFLLSLMSHRERPYLPHGWHFLNDRELHLLMNHFKYKTDWYKHLKFRRLMTFCFIVSIQR